jgi:hypothetical protein
MTAAKDIYEASAKEFAANKQYDYAARHYEMAEQLTEDVKERKRLLGLAKQCRALVLAV